MSKAPFGKGIDFASMETWARWCGGDDPVAQNEYMLFFKVGLRTGELRVLKEDPVGFRFYTLERDAVREFLEKHGKRPAAIFTEDRASGSNVPMGELIEAIEAMRSTNLLLNQDDTIEAARSDFKAAGRRATRESLREAYKKMDPNLKRAVGRPKKQV